MLLQADKARSRHSTRKNENLEKSLQKADLERYKSNATPSIDKYVNTLNLSNIGSVNNVSINYQLNKDVININWTANITNKCSELIDNKCAYGIIYKITWKYTK